ncbi:bacteriocin immunity protein [Companilactobacillus sp.]|jgi:hypothetical protein|uniref:bacteriocin immunity protein n=1 Tax=Companilactobacillus sp. TaxID=2767905 RepID=UPI0025C50E56|nr:bacteriocin immunity protein [Companilactobacillus sp.]MCH4009632.1 bacteriocin immunity protein [Companilactobacillus sp.]MCH4052692.1 bacteriocin immunity protein [Companilactobacillus sp.]MCH4077574.1 bacteriocin immunity protein [Companilactobacillus sp.]MCH4126150.1 bacteriocin immunity protein [Companilactobacillus sp.]MCI1311858.1 bacteriocin immunity protein [Companilactobacillus sp.]
MNDNNQEINQLLDLLGQTYSDPQVQRNPSLKNLLQTVAADLEQSKDIELIINKYFKSLSLADSLSQSSTLNKLIVTLKNHSS